MTVLVNFDTQFVKINSSTGWPGNNYVNQDSQEAKIPVCLGHMSAGIESMYHHAWLTF